MFDYDFFSIWLVVCDCITNGMAFHPDYNLVSCPLDSHNQDLLSQLRLKRGEWKFAVLQFQAIRLYVSYFQSILWHSVNLAFITTVLVFRWLSTCLSKFCVFFSMVFWFRVPTGDSVNRGFTVQHRLQEHYSGDFRMGFFFRISSLRFNFKVMTLFSNLQVILA